MTVSHFCNAVEGINIRIRIRILITSQEIIYSLRSCFRIEEANYDGSCRRIMIAFYDRAPRNLIFYNNTLYWEDNELFWKNYKRIWQTNRTTGVTTWFYTTANRIINIGIVTEGKNSNLEMNFSVSGQATLN